VLYSVELRDQFFYPVLPETSPTSVGVLIQLSYGTIPFNRAANIG